MVDASHLPFRLLCKRHGADVCYTQMFHSGQFAKEEGFRRKIFATCPADQPLVAQLCGNDPDTMAEAGSYLEGQCACIDVNLGCPQKIARKGAYGAFIADHPDLVRSIVETMTRKLKTPVSCKMRLFDSIEQSIQFALMLQAAGCKVLAVHGRTRKQVSLSTTTADWSAIARIVEAVDIPVIANGSVKTYADIEACLAQTHAQAVMVGTGIMADPAMFSGEHVPHWVLAEEFIDLCEEHQTPLPAVRGILVKMTVDSVTRYADIRESLVTAETVAEVRSIVADMKYRDLAKIAPVPVGDARPQWAWSAPNGDVEVDFREHEGFVAWRDVIVHATAPVLPNQEERPGRQWVQLQVGKRHLPIATLRRLRDALTWRAWDCRHSAIYVDVVDGDVYAQLLQHRKLRVYYRPGPPPPPSAAQGETYGDYDDDHTLDDLVFAAFQAPVLSLSARVLFHHRAFTALLLLRSCWRTERRLSRSEVRAALLSAKCCRPDTLAGVDCARCGGVLSVSENSREQERLRREVPRGVELYAVTVRAQCTSSRRHVGSAMLVLAAQVLPDVAIVSDRFAIYARHAARHVRPAPRGGDVVDTRLVPLSPAHSSPVPRMEEFFFVRPQAAAPSQVLVDPDLRLRQPGPLGMAVSVVINSAAGLTEEENQLMAAGIVPHLQANVPGYLVHKTSVRSSVVIVVLGFQSPRDFALAHGFAQRYVRNELRNPLNRNLIGDGLGQKLLISSNMD
eukprot:m51a1_g14135 putative t-dirnahydrouridine synthase (734) ;mRNA; r:231163-235329